MGIDGSNNRLWKSQRNVIVHVPVPIFFEFLRNDFQRETTTKVVDKIEDFIYRFTQRIGMKKKLLFFVGIMEWYEGRSQTLAD